MTNSLITSAALDAYPGAPFDDYLLDLAVAGIRAEAGWHIAPQVTETLTVDSYGGQLLVLPTRRIVSVTAVRDVTASPSTSLTTYRPLVGGLWRRNGWPVGTIEVDLTHGYASVPLDLVPVIVARVKNTTVRDPAVSQHSVSAGPFGESTTYRSTGPAVDPTVLRYTVLDGVA